MSLGPAWAVAFVAILCHVCPDAAVARDITPSTDEAIARGLVYQMAAPGELYGLQGYGCGFVDLDLDGDQDVIIMGRVDGRVGIFENDGTGNFIDHSLTSGIPLLTEGSGFAAANLVGDGQIDIYLAQVGLPNVLARNDGGFTFTDVTAAAGVGDVGASTGVCLGDYDNDGHIDIYVPNYNGVAGTFTIDSTLYHNEGDGTFTDVGVALGVNDAGKGFQGVWFDYDLDGDLDLYLSNDFGHVTGLPNRLWRNNGGTFEDVSVSSGAGVALYSMGVACGDFDGNGIGDLYCTNVPGGGGFNNPLLLTQPAGTFVEASVIAGVDNPYTSWGSIFYDFDNDARLDLYVNNRSEPNALYLNLGFPCGDFAATAAVEGNTNGSFSSAVGDVDNDGDLDLLLNNVGSNVQLFINHEGTERNWARVQVRGDDDNPSAVGARVQLRTGATWQMQELLAGGNSYQGQNETVAHFGLDASTGVDEIIVTWPGGSPTRRYTNLSVNQIFFADVELTGDVNADGKVGILDLLRVLNAWGLCDCGEDINGNGAVDIVDLLTVLSNWSP